MGRKFHGKTKLPTSVVILLSKSTGFLSLLQAWLLQPPPDRPNPRNLRRGRSGSPRMAGPTTSTTTTAPRSGSTLFPCQDHSRRRGARQRGILLGYVGRASCVVRLLSVSPKHHLELFRPCHLTTLSSEGRSGECGRAPDTFVGVDVAAFTSRPPRQRPRPKTKPSTPPPSI